MKKKKTSINVRGVGAPLKVKLVSVVAPQEKRFALVALVSSLKSAVRSK